LSGLARSTYYRRPDPVRAQAVAAADTVLRTTIEAITGEFPGYGYRRVTHELRRRGTLVNHKRVARVMRESALLRGVQPDGPNQVWVADLTYLRLEREFAYLAVILDAWSRKVVGYAVGPLLDARLPLAALEAALESRCPPPGLIHHSDRGVQYASWRYRERLAEAGLRGSMSRTGNPYDNAQVESFIKTLKHEEVYLHDYATVQDAIDRIPHFLEEIYNRQRLHSSLGYRPPEEYEALHAQTAA
jgi:putative transposase